MTQGRRAADRRRERAGGDDKVDDFDDDEIGTTPGAVPASPHSDYEEVDDETGLNMRRPTPGMASVPSATPSMIVEMPLSEDGSGQASRPQARDGRGAPAVPSGRGRLVDDEPIDAEKSFARELKRRPPERPTRVTAPLEKTEVKELKERRPRLGGRFVVVAAETPPTDDSGAPLASLPIAVFPCLLGRSRDADLRFPDATISLRHAELAWDEDAAGHGEESLFSILDLGSTSGTLVNGVAITGRTPLFHGDIIALGKTELRLHKADAAPTARPVPEPPVELSGMGTVPGTEVEVRTSTTLRQARDAQARKEREAAEALSRRRADVRKKALTVIAACVALLGVVALGTFVYRTALSDNAPAQIRHQVAVLLGEAKKRITQGDVDGAAARVSTILGLDPENAEAKSLDRLVSSEKDARDALQLALRLGDEDRDNEALDALQRIADTSVFAKDRDRLRQALAERALVRSLRAVENLLDQGRYDDALARAEEHVRRFPDDPGGKALLERVQSQKAGAPKDPALGPARAAFANGDVDGARTIAEAAGYRGYVADLERFAENLRQGQEAMKRFDAAAARPPLDEAFRLLQSLGASPSSSMFATVQKPYADALYLQGTELAEAGDGCSAARNFLKAARVLPGDPRLEAELQKLDSKADQGLQRARGAKSQDPERAAALAREALCFARTGSPVWTELRAIAR